MTHPTRAKTPMTPAEAMARISDAEMTRMCLCVNQMPERHQRRRTKGWRKPEGAVIVDRTTKWGNPFTISDCRETGYTGTDAQIAARCVEAFRVWLGPHWRNNWSGQESEAARALILTHLPELRGKDLCCPCPLDQPCHADVLIEFANSGPDP